MLARAGLMRHLVPRGKGIKICTRRSCLGAIVRARSITRNRGHETSSICVRVLVPVSCSGGLLEIRARPNDAEAVVAALARGVVA